MAQEPRAPWSRWDRPATNIYPPVRYRESNFNGEGRYEDATLPYQINARQSFSLATVNNGGTDYSNFATSPRISNFVSATLLAKEPNKLDPLFYDCVYGIPNEIAQLIEQCHRDVDCCERTCCENGWHLKYGWALLLLFLFCAAAVALSLLWLASWTGHRIKWREKMEDNLEKRSPTITSALFPVTSLPRVELRSQPQVKMTAAADLRPNSPEFQHQQNRNKY